MTEHSPTPWIIGPWEPSEEHKPSTQYPKAGAIKVTAADGYSVGQTGSLIAAANLRHIVHCVNAHDDLLAALKEVSAFVGRLRGGDRPAPSEVSTHWTRTQRAIAKAKPQETGS